MTHGRGKSDSAIVAVKPANKAALPTAEQSVVGPAAAEPVEPRVGTEGNANQQSTHRAQSRASVSQALERIRKVARERKKEKFTALLHHISIDLLGEAFFELKKDAAPGVDGLTWRTYEADLDRNLTDLHELIEEHIGHYRHGECMYPSRTAASARSRLLRWRTRLSNERRSRCSTRSTRKISSGSRTVSDPDAARTMRWMRLRLESIART